MPGGGKIIIDSDAVKSESLATSDLMEGVKQSLTILLPYANWSTEVGPICDNICKFADTIASGRENIRYAIRDLSAKYAAVGSGNSTGNTAVSVKTS